MTITVADNTTTQPPTPQVPSTTTKSGDATLKSITIGGKTYSGSSLKNAITYTAGANVNSIKISAAKSNSKATVSGTGTKQLVQGQTNTFQINVTAENGTKKTYTVNIIRLAEESTVPNIIDDQPIQNPEETKLMLTSLIIKDVELNPEFNSEIYTYVTNVQNMKNLEIDATANKPDAQINIEGATDLKAGDNLIKITVTLGEEKIEYMVNVYNTIEEDITGITQDENNDNNKKNEKNIKKYVLIGLTFLIGLIAIRYIVISYKLSRELEGDIDDIMLDDEEENTEVKNQNLVTPSIKTGRHF